MTRQEFDIAIVGGGMNGAALALALSGSGLSVAMIETLALDAGYRPSYDDRGIALAHGTARILKNIGVWDHLRPNAEPIRRIHVSDRGHFGFTHLDAAEEGVAALGYVATAHAIGAALATGLKSTEGLRLFCPATLERFTIGADRVELSLRQQGQSLPMGARLLVAADGAESPIRSQLAIPVREWNYGHHALIANLTPALPHRGVAYERFTDSGPLAALPLPGNRCAIVWTALDQQVDEIMGLDDEAFLARLEQRFGQRLGRFGKLGARAAYPLKMRQVREHYRPRALIIGNAAHTVHPIAGQGFNLGIRDVALLAELLIDAARAGSDPGAEALLQAYAAGRDRDQQAVTLATDLLARLFSNPLPPLRIARDLGMLAIDLLPGATHLLARRAMGLGGRLPRLART
ncbi:MAG: 2-octaprenyl-6-methoxyphenyl hydroxylase [Gammaproteobacteria bacterium]|nr:2-octaprenyl-6-methoxyphenyl hydroxylase [Gammaproteobacteria bacterium]MBU1656260.1 2-octaprenyl-6-methoxyphenyl hydroxylase [Gammaproteobacteria bacterium]MBU1959825.1 2-octaprenyl-6-methoxyphenyl hydroxylase [Gammaproteobacteria bacterium]